MAEQIQMTAEQKARVEDKNKIDETIPGGKYIVGDNYVNSENEVIGAVKADEKKADK